MPIGANAVTNSLPKAHHEPRKCGDCEGDEIPFPSPLQCPAEAIEHDEQRVEDEEEDIQKLKSGVAHWSMFTNFSALEFQGKEQEAAVTAGVSNTLSLDTI